MANCKYFKTTLKIQNYIDEETKSKAYSGNAYYVVYFSLVYLFIRSVTYVALDTSITDYILQHNI
jgi:hypothetical protein